MDARLYKYPELYFTTATIKGWKYLLEQDKYKLILTESMNYWAEEKNVLIFAFVIMPNHFHIVWQLLDGFSLGNVQQIPCENIIFAQVLDSKGNSIIKKATCIK